MLPSVGNCISSCCLSASPVAMHMFTVDCILILLCFYGLFWFNPCSSMQLKKMQICLGFSSTWNPFFRASQSFLLPLLQPHCSNTSFHDSPSGSLCKNGLSPHSLLSTWPLILPLKAHCTHGGKAHTLHSLTWPSSSTLHQWVCEALSIYRLCLNSTVSREISITS